MFSSNNFFNLTYDEVKRRFKEPELLRRYNKHCGSNIKLIADDPQSIIQIGEFSHMLQFNQWFDLKNISNSLQIGFFEVLDYKLAIRVMNGKDIMIVERFKKTQYEIDFWPLIITYDINDKTRTVEELVYHGQSYTGIPYKQLEINLIRWDKNTIANIYKIISIYLPKILVRIIIYYILLDVQAMD